MPYTRNSELPPSVRDVLPDKAQTVFRTVFNQQVYDEERDENAAFRIAWAAVGRGWKKPRGKGVWVRKDAPYAHSFAEALQRVHKGEPRTLYVRRDVKNADEIIDWAKSQGFATTLPADDMHVTIAYSKAPVDWEEMGERPAKLIVEPDNEGETAKFIAKLRKLDRFGPEKDAAVLQFSNGDLERRWRELCEKGCTWEHDGYRPHITLSYDAADVDFDKVEPYTGEIVLGPEIFEEVKENWKDSVTEKRGARHTRKEYEMLQQMHDHCVSLGAECGGTEGGFQKFEEVQYDAKVAKVDEKLGLVFGWAIVCKEHDGTDFQPYYDLQGDHIDESAMLKAATDFMLNSRTHKVMHDGQAVGDFVFAFPMTEDIAKAMDVTPDKTGLMIAVKPTPDILQKFESGEYTGFSIGGRRIIDEEMD